MRDLTFMHLLCPIVTIVALVTLERRVVLAAGWAWIVWSVPHIVDHLRRRDVLDPADRFSSIGGLVLLLALAVFVVALPVRSNEPAAVP